VLLLLYPVTTVRQGWVRQVGTLEILFNDRQQPAMLLSGALFSLVHTNVIGFVPILVLGCFLADLYERTGSLGAPIAIHMLHNTFLLGIALTYRMAV